jgi:hypothetical protein
METVHILLGSNEEHESFAEAVADGESVSWIVPKPAQPGDLALLLFGKYIAATGRIEDHPEPAERLGRYSARVGSLIGLKKPLPISDLITRFEGRWEWPTYPRGYTTVPEYIAAELLDLLDRVAPARHPKVAEDVLSPFDPEHEEDGRRRILRAITERQGQGAFRAEVLAAYGGQCAISRCQCVDVLDAAHIVPYNGEKTNDIRNGLLLRTDLHTLFDRHRLAVDPQTMTVVVDPSIDDRSYRIFDGKKLTLPDQAKLQPSKDALKKHFRQCSFAEKK